MEGGKEGKGERGREGRRERGREEGREGGREGRSKRRMASKSHHECTQLG